MIDEERVRSRSEDLLPEELAAGSDDPEAQARALLQDSDDREHYREPTPDLSIDHRTSDDATATG